MNMNMNMNMKMKMVLRKLFLVPMVALLVLTAGCNDFERTAFQTLSASKTTVDQIAADYNAKKLPQNETAYKAVTALRAAQTTAVDAMMEYETIKAAKGSATALQAQQVIVTNALAALPPLIAAAKALYSSLSSTQRQKEFEARWGAAAGPDHVRALARLAGPPAIAHPATVQ